MTLEVPSDYGAPATPSWRSVDWRAHRREVETRLGSVSCVEIGPVNAPPLVLLQDPRQSWRIWLESVPSLARVRRVLVLDLGVSRVTKDQEIPRMRTRDLADAVQDVCDARGIGRAAFAGNSIAALVAADLAHRYPDRVECLVLVDVPDSEALSDAQVPIEFLVSHSELIAPDLLFELRKDEVPRAADASFVAPSQSFSGPPPIDVPTLLVGAGEAAAASGRRRFDLRKVGIKGTRRLPMIERPSKFNALVHSFLADSHIGAEARRAPLAA